MINYTIVLFKPVWILIKQEMSRSRWHQLDHMQIICTSLQTDNYASTSSLNFLEGGRSSWRSTNSVKALKAYSWWFNNNHDHNCNELLPLCRGDSWYVARHCHWSDKRYRQAHHHHHRTHQGNNILALMLIHSSSKRKYGLLPQYYGHRISAV